MERKIKKPGFSVFDSIEYIVRMTKVKANNRNKQTKSNEVKKEKIPLANRPYLIWLTLGIALFGAVLGGLPNLYNIIIDKPKFNFTFVGINAFRTFNDNNPTKQHSAFLINGAIGNDGNRALFPQAYLAKIKDNKNDITYDLVQTQPDSTMIKLESNNATYYFDSVITQNLYRVKKIAANDAVYGNLLFVSTDTIEIVPPVDFTFQITCIDIYNKKYTSDFPVTFDVSSETKGTKLIPSNNVRMITK